MPIFTPEQKLVKLVSALAIVVGDVAVKTESDWTAAKEANAFSTERKSLDSRLIPDPFFPI